MKDFNATKKGFKSVRFGFSLVEILIVIAFMVIIGAIGLGNYFQHHRQTILETTLNEMVAFLYEVQQRSKGQHENSQWGVRFTNPTSGASSYSSFRGASFTTPVDTRFLDGALDFSFPPDGQSVDIIFNRINGRVSDGQFKRVYVQLSPGATTRAIKVSPAGVISHNRGEVGWWNFDDANNRHRDISVYGNHGSCAGGTCPSVADRAPGRGQVLNFDGIDDFVSVPHSEPLNSQVFGTSTTFTLSAWAFPRAWANWASIMNKARGGCWSHTTNGVWASDQGGFTCAMGSGTEPASCNPAGSIIMVHHRPSLNSWSHIVCTANGNNLIMFVDGREVGRVAIAGLTHLRSSNTEPLIFGRRTIADGPSFNGLIDDVRIYDRALSASEVMELYETTR